MTFVVSIGLTIALVLITSIFHYEVLQRMAAWSGNSRRRRHGMIVRVLSVLVATHIVEVLAYSAVFAVGVAVGLGSLTTTQGPMDALAFFYFSAETFSTAGYGDIVPQGALRIIASIESLNGLLLLAWSGSFLFSQVQSSPKAGE